MMESLSSLTSAMAFSAGRNRSSISITVTCWAPALSKDRVSPPGPGPISATCTSSSGKASRAILSVIFMSSRKCCPSFLLAPRPYSRKVSDRLGRLSSMAGSGDLAGHFDGGDQAIGTGFILTGDIKGRAVIRGGPNNG